MSLIVATKKRVDPLRRLLESVAEQAQACFEVIIVDQNPDERLDLLVREAARGLHLKRVRIPDRGVSHARNVGGSTAVGEILGFPDDDCWYRDDTLQRVVSFFNQRVEYAGLCGRTVDPAGNPALGRWATVPGEINRYNEWTRSIENALFVRQSVFRELGGFDVTLGPGSGTPWSAHEGDDLILRGIEAGHRFFYQPSLAVVHPRARRSGPDTELARARAYGRGMGRVLRIHRYPAWFCAYWLGRALGGIVLGLLRADHHAVRRHWQRLLGRLEGLRGT